MVKLTEKKLEEMRNLIRKNKELIDLEEYNNQVITRKDLDKALGELYTEIMTILQ